MKVTQEQALEALVRLYAQGCAACDHRYAEEHSGDGDYDIVRQYIEGQEWQPIESAPRDGSVFLVHMKGCKYPLHAKITLDAGLIYLSATKGQWWKAETNKFTHWKPLPEPPQEKS